MKLISKTAVKRYTGRRISQEFIDRLDGKVRAMLDRAMDWPANRKTMRDFI